jgi:uncharacterized protein YciI
MIFCRFAYDAEAKSTERQALLEGHKAHLRSGLARVLQSGPLFSSDGSNRKLGALVVFEAESVAEVEAFNARDPYVVAGVYDRVEIARWDKTIG